MKTLFVAVFFLVSCGSEEDNTPINPQDEPICLSCNAKLPEETPIPETKGYVQLQPSELIFVCATNTGTCNNVQSTFVYNHTASSVPVYRPRIERDPDQVMPYDISLFNIISDAAYPVILEPGKSFQIDVSFEWTTDTQEGLLVVQVSAETLSAKLMGKMFDL